MKVELSEYDRRLLEAIIITLGGQVPRKSATDDISLGQRRFLEKLPRVEGEGDWALFNDEKEGDELE